MSKGFMELLPWLIPVTLSPQVSATLAAVRYESNNGYDYLWRVLELAVPGFDPTVSITIPSWDTADDIFHFAQAYLLYFRLQAKVNFHYDDRTRSGIFLRAVQFSDYADTVTTLQSHVNSFRDEYEDGYLPPHLRLHGLATSINQNAQARLRDIANPRMRRLDGDFSRVQGVPTCHRVGREETPRGGGFRDRGGDPHPVAFVMVTVTAVPPAAADSFHAPIVTVGLFYPTSSVQLASGSAMWLNTATCWPPPFASNGT